MSEKTNNKRNVLIISHDKIGDNMAGPGIRYHFMAETLSRHFDVTVGFFDPKYLPNDEFSRSYQVAHVDKGEFQPEFEGKDVVISMWLSEDMIAYCNEKGIYTVLDIYAPAPVENLALFLYSGDPITTDTDYYYRQSYNMYPEFFKNGDLFLFSNRRQLDYWMGFAFGSNLISVSNYDKRPLFDRFVFAPMGINTKQELVHKRAVIKGAIEGINDTDKVLLWTGGIWNWFDAQVLIRAMKLLETSHPEIKLVFFGTKHPNPDVPAMKEATDAYQLAEELGLRDKTVFMHEGWVPYNDRIDYLLEADAAVNTTKDTIEAETAHRTRVLDHILTNLPTVATAGDYLADDVLTQKDIGLSVPPENPEALSEAIVSILDPATNARMRQNISAIRSEYDWEETLRPLVDQLTTNLEKLPAVVYKVPREMPKNKLSYKVAKKILPRPVKSIIVKLLRYGR